MDERLLTLVVPGIGLVSGLIATYGTAEERSRQRLKAGGGRGGADAIEA
jgi:hypothetical protein